MASPDAWALTKEEGQALLKRAEEFMIPFEMVLNSRHLRVWLRKRPLKHAQLHRDHASWCVALSGHARGLSVSHDIESSLCGDALFIRRYQSKTASRYHVSQRRNGCNTDSTHIQHHEAFVSENTRGQSKTVRHHCLGFRGVVCRV
jgi:hypothetical protein